MFVQFMANFWQLIEIGNGILNRDFSIFHVFCNSHFSRLFIIWNLTIVKRPVSIFIKMPTQQRWPESYFSDSDSAPVPKFLNPGPDPGSESFQIWETDSCSDSGYNHWSNRNLPMFFA